MKIISMNTCQNQADENLELLKGKKYLAVYICPETDTYQLIKGNLTDYEAHFMCHCGMQYLLKGVD